MRREYFELHVCDTDWVGADAPPRTPTLCIEFDGPTDALDERLAGSTGASLDGSETDVTYRLHADLDAPDVTGVLAITNRVTGDFVLELNADAASVRRFVRAARAYGKRADDDLHYRIRVSIHGQERLVHEKSIFLVYDAEGSLLRQQSLIPGGVEL